MANIIENKLNTKIDNLKAHVSVLKGDIEIYLAQTDSILNDKKLAATQLARITAEIAERSASEVAAYEERRQELELVGSLLKEKEGVLLVDKAQLATERNNFENYKTMEKFILEDEKGYLNDEIYTLKNEIAEYNDSISNLEENYISLMKRNRDANDNQEFAWNTTQIELEQAEDTLSEAKNELSLIEKKKEDTMVELSKLLGSKATLLTNLDSREKAVSVREKDAAVIARRLQKLYKTHYPNRKLDI